MHPSMELSRSKLILFQYNFNKEKIFDFTYNNLQPRILVWCLSWVTKTVKPTWRIPVTRQRSTASSPRHRNRTFSMSRGVCSTNQQTRPFWWTIWMTMWIRMTRRWLLTTRPLCSLTPTRGGEVTSELIFRTLPLVLSSKILFFLHNILKFQSLFN